MLAGMIYLLAVSLLWSFSFGLINVSFSGVPGELVAFLRLGIALPVFLPFLRVAGLPVRDGLVLAAIGAVQYGLMYVALFNAFKWLQGHEVALLTVVTPIWVVVFHSLWRRSMHGLYFIVAVIAVAGGAVLQMPEAWAAPVQGIIWMQISNAAFALGQVWYVQHRKRWHPGFNDHGIYALLYAGGVVFSAAALTLSGKWGAIAGLDSGQWWALLYLGAIASGLGFFGWNRGAAQVNAGVLAVWNNLKIPLAVVVSLMVFGEDASLRTLAIGATLILASLWLATCRGNSRKDIAL